jgi:hypothetical protein
MGRKSASKSQAAPPAAPPIGPKRSLTAIVVVIVMAVVLAASAFVYLRQVDAVSQTSAPSVPTISPGSPASPVSSVATVPSDLKPHVQEKLPPLNFPGYQTQRSPEVIRAAYKFAAEHPEVLSYVPCFCGCERSGHRGNEDCFVRERAVNGDVISWEDHGMECAVCIDVAHRSLQLFTSGKSVGDIRATIEREWAGRMPGHTPTPTVPHSH